MINLSLILLSFVFFIQLGRVFPATQLFFNGDQMVVEGNSCNSSEIKLLLIDRNVSKIRVHLTHTFYADEDLKLNGITELQIFASTWHCTKPVTFDLSGSDGASQEPPKVKGSPGRRGNDGKNGGSFLGLTNRTINGDYLRVISNGGSGGVGQAGAASDDVYVLLNVDHDSGASGLFNSGDLHNYYKQFFTDRGYDAEVSDTDTSFYAALLRDKKASINVRLHSRECCGTTGISGPGGHGGLPGTFVFRHLGKSRGSIESQTTPTFVGNDGPLGKLGKNGEICENRALEVRIDVELVEVVFVFRPLRHAFSNNFTVLNHTISSKCAPEYVSSDNTTMVKTMEPPNDVDVVSSILLYKMFLLESMKNGSDGAQEIYKAIDDNWEVNRQNSFKGLLREACELEEKNNFELEKTVKVVVIPIYQRLLERIGRVNYNRDDEDVEKARNCLRSLLEIRLNDLKNDDNENLILNLELYTEVAVWILNTRQQRLSPIPQFKDLELQNRFKQLQFEINGKFILAEYDHVVKGLQLTYFPFAAEYLDFYDMSTSLSNYTNLEDLHTTAISNINAVNSTIQRIQHSGMNGCTTIIFNYLDVSRQSNALFVWKYSNNRNNIRKLFAGETITLLADVKQSKRKLHALKFKQIDWYFRSSEQHVTDELNNVLKYFEVELRHNGRSGFRWASNFYEILSEPLELSFSFEKNERDLPLSRLSSYDKLLHNTPTLSPYASWEIRLVPLRNDNPLRNEDMRRLARYATVPIDIELYGAGTFVLDDSRYCYIKDLAKIYTQI